MTKMIYTLWNTYLIYSRLYGAMWKQQMMTSDITEGSSWSLPTQEELQHFDCWQQNALAESLWGRSALDASFVAPSPEVVEGKDPLLCQHRPTTDPQGSLLLHPAAIQPPELFCCCPHRLKNTVQGPAGTQDRIFLTAIISYWICAWGPTGDVAGEDSRANLYYFLYRQYYPIPIPLLPYSQSTVKPY